ncbi:MAG: glucosaminidase domain-containing protein [Bacteroidales bacterium]|jgi:hypothetical protein|nr:glucosaminidase domain-containing protein [Bacteroidales bacterium]
MKYFYLIILFFISATLFSQITQQEYIDIYKDLAISEMQRVKIPASITLAQGLLESSNGNSFLAKEGKNHFGIKCKKDWTGQTVYLDDDSKNECFRKYNSVEESFKDHSDFLSDNSRYAFLFDYDLYDYQSWALGLKKAGYATNPTYAERLIELIERLNLSQFDNYKALETVAVINVIENVSKPEKIQKNEDFEIEIKSLINNHEIYVHNDVPYIILENNMTVKEIAKELEMMRWQISYFNDLGIRKELKKGEVIYLQKKKNKATKDNKYHIVEENETLQNIAQLYGIRLKSLAKINNLRKDDIPEVRTKLKLQ